MEQSLSWYKVYFKGGDADRPHEETMGVQGTSIADARKNAIAQMRLDFGIQDPQINEILLMPGQPEL
jgi:hypothetical protein